MINLIFDMDGTLIDSANAIVNAVNEIRAKLALAPLKRAFIIELMNNPKKDFKKIAYENRLDFDTEDIFKKHYKESVILYEGVDALLKECKEKGFFLALATNASSKTTKNILSKTNILAYFELILCAGDGYEEKPSPQMIELICKKAPFKQSLFIGDSDKDILSAKNANIPCLVVNWYEDEGLNSKKALEEEIKLFVNKL